MASLSQIKTKGDLRFNNLISNFILCIWVFGLHVYKCTTRMCPVFSEVKRVLDPLELELETSVRCHVYAGQTQVWKSNLALISTEPLNIIFKSSTNHLHGWKKKKKEKQISARW